jgi:hypothetical protein
MSTSLDQSLPFVHDLLNPPNHAVEVVSLKDGMHAHRIQQPGRVLTPVQQEAIYGALVPVTTLSFGADMTPYWAQRRKDEYFRHLAEFVLISDTKGHMVGWTGYAVLHQQDYCNLYIDSTGITPHWQASGIMTPVLRDCLVRAAQHEQAYGQRVYISARSESPIFYKLMRHIVGAERLYPNLAAPLPDSILQCGRELATWLGQQAILKPTTLILCGAYAAVLDTLYGELPSTGDAALDRLFRDQLGPLDAYLLIGEMPTLVHSEEVVVC